MSTLEMIVDRNIRERHKLVCSMGVASRSIAGLREQRIACALALKLFIESC